MSHDDFYQRALLMYAQWIVDRADKVPTPEQVAKKAGEYADALHNEMVAGLTRCDIREFTAPKPAPEPPRPEVPVLQPSRLQPKKTGWGVSPPPAEPVDELEAPTCPKCSADMKKRKGQFGPFWGCSNYPTCRGIVNIRSET